ADDNDVVGRLGLWTPPNLRPILVMMKQAVAGQAPDRIAGHVDFEREKRGAAVATLSEQRSKSSGGNRPLLHRCFHGASGGLNTSPACLRNRCKTSSPSRLAPLAPRDG